MSKKMPTTRAMKVMLERQVSEIKSYNNILTFTGAFESVLIPATEGINDMKGLKGVEGKLKEQQGIGAKIKWIVDKIVKFVRFIIAKIGEFFKWLGSLIDKGTAAVKAKIAEGKLKIDAAKTATTTKAGKMGADAVTKTVTVTKWVEGQLAAMYSKIKSDPEAGNKFKTELEDLMDSEVKSIEKMLSDAKEIQDEVGRKGKAASASADKEKARADRAETAKKQKGLDDTFNAKGVANPDTVAKIANEIEKRLKVSNEAILAVLKNMERALKSLESMEDVDGKAAAVAAYSAAFTELTGLATKVMGGGQSLLNEILTENGFTMAA
jgi:hypothetical protein